MTIPSKRTKYPIVNGVMTYPDGRERCNKLNAGIAKYYGRTMDMAERQGYQCAICEKPFGIGINVPTFDHQAGRGSNSSHRDDRIFIGDEWHNAALCANCNTQKGSRRYHWVGKSYVPVESNSLQHEFRVRFDGENELSAGEPK